MSMTSKALASTHLLLSFPEQHSRDAIQLPYIVTDISFVLGAAKNKETCLTVCWKGTLERQNTFVPCTYASFTKFSRYRRFTIRACKYADWRPHEGFWVSDDFWDYPRRPFLPFNDLDCSAALRCQLALIDSDPDVLYHLAPNTDVSAQLLCWLLDFISL